MKSKTQRGPGRPMAEIKIPNGKFTFADMVEANSHVTPLTLRKFLKRDASKRNKSEIVLVKNETREPDSKKGLGRKTFVYIRRSKVGTMKVARKSTVSVPLAAETAPVAETPAPEVAVVETATVAAEAEAEVSTIPIDPVTA